MSLVGVLKGGTRSLDYSAYVGGTQTYSQLSHEFSTVGRVPNLM